MPIELKPQEVVRSNFPFASITKVHNILCADGKQRVAEITGEPDTYFSVPARVRVKGIWVSGFAVCETLQGFSTATDDDPAVWKFIAYQYGKNAALLPRGSYREAS